MTSFRIKYINYFGSKLPILLQSVNGPCPFLALANVLLLTKRLSITNESKYVKIEEISLKIIDLILKYHPNLNVDELYTALTNMQYGINIDCGFKDNFDLTISSDLDIYKLLNIKIVHGWVIPSHDVLYYPILVKFTYNKLMDQLVLLDDNKSDKEGIDLSYSEAQTVKEFMANYGSQLTEEGITMLKTNLDEKKPAILFYNNHLSLILKFKDELYCLVTDIGYRNSLCIWEKLDNIYNNNTFYTDKFKPYVEELNKTKLNFLNKSPRKDRPEYLKKLTNISSSRSTHSHSSSMETRKKKPLCNFM